MDSSPLDSLILWVNVEYVYNKKGWLRGYVFYA